MARPKPTGITQSQVRVPTVIWKRLAEAARREHRSTNAQLVKNLEDIYGPADTPRPNRPGAADK